MMDEETRSLWDPMTGKAFKGPMAGAAMDIWPVFYSTTKKETSAFKNTQLFLSKNRNPLKWVFQKIFRPLLGLDSRGFIPPYFFGTMSAPIDPRLPKLTQGLGVIADKKARYYPLDCIAPGETIREIWGGEELMITRAEDSAIVEAVWSSTGEKPMQLLSRWYGFAFTYPNCEVFQTTDQ